MAIVDQRIIDLDQKTPVVFEFQVSAGGSVFSHLIDVTNITDPNIILTMSVELSENGGPFKSDPDFTFIGGKYLQTDNKTPATVAGREGFLGIEGMYSLDGGSNFKSRIGMTTEESDILSKTKGVIYKKQVVTYKSLTIRKTFQVTGNQTPLQFSIMTSVN